MKIENNDYIGQQPDPSKHFYSIGNIYYNADTLTGFDEKMLTGSVNFKRYERKGRFGFNIYTCPFEESKSWTFPPAYGDEPSYPIKLSFEAENVLRIHTAYTNSPLVERESLMLDNSRKSDVKYDCITTEDGFLIKTSLLSVEVKNKPFQFVVRDSEGKILTQTLNMSSGKCLQNCNPLPFSYVQTTTDMKKHSAASFSIFPDEHFYGCGESFTKLDKAGQKLTLWTKDAHGVETPDMYKPIPFYISSRGYGIFTHTSNAVTYDLGQSYSEAQTIFIDNDDVDLFIIAGTPKEILNSYTDISGKAEVPPLWSFGLWMSRITYKSEQEAREVAAKLKEHRMPCDVIHLDTGWFENDWRCDYIFAPTRFDDPKKMLEDLLKDGYHVSLWQLPYFTPNNTLFQEIVDKGLAVVDGDGKLPTDDAVLDFSNPQTVLWYQDKLKALFDIGVAAIKVDFGEAAPLTGAYHSGKSGAHEHNLYPLRYNKAVADITKKATGDSIIWARSAWAGSQRYPLHWGGDCENTNMGMLTSLRGGLSFGMSGFSFWSHDTGGFVRKSPEELYGRWSFMGIFTSHMRCHGEPPKEPWNYSEEFLNLFREQLNLRYKLMPYIYAQSIKAVNMGCPMLRSMFVEFPNDRNCYSLEDQYMFGDDILVAPIFEDNGTSRDVYLPKGKWHNLFNGEVYDGEKWHCLNTSALKGVALVRDGAVIPMVDVALTTKDIDWKTLTLHWFTTDKAIATGTNLNINKNEIYPIDRETLVENYVLGL